MTGARVEVSASCCAKPLDSVCVFIYGCESSLEWDLELCIEIRVQQRARDATRTRMGNRCLKIPIDFEKNSSELILRSTIEIRVSDAARTRTRMEIDV